eukprot:3262375-Rhodomonas_salina.2
MAVCCQLACPGRGHEGCFLGVSGTGCVCRLWSSACVALIERVAVWRQGPFTREGSFKGAKTDDLFPVSSLIGLRAGCGTCGLDTQRVVLTQRTVSSLCDGNPLSSKSRTDRACGARSQEIGASSPVKTAARAKLAYVLQRPHRALKTRISLEYDVTFICAVSEADIGRAVPQDTGDLLDFGASPRGDAGNDPLNDLFGPSHPLSPKNRPKPSGSIALKLFVARSGWRLTLVAGVLGGDTPSINAGHTQEDDRRAALCDGGVGCGMRDARCEMGKSDVGCMCVCV